MASIRKQLLVMFLVGLLGSTSLVNSFSISKNRRSARNTDLAEALAILQRQRRRVGVEDFLNSERLLEERPLTLEDVSDWLSRSNDDADVIGNGRRESWMPPPPSLPESGSFKDFDLSEGDYNTDSMELSSPTRVKASQNEVNDIFSSNNGEPEMEEGKLEKKKKEEMVIPKRDAQMQNKHVSSDRDALNSLTDEEIRVLVKAVGKLQSRENGDAAKVKKSPEISELSIDATPFDTVQNGDQVVISEPVSQEELKSVFQETNGPITKETVVVEQKLPGQETPEMIEQEIVSEKLPDDSTIVRERHLTNLLPQVIENEIEAEKAEEENEAAVQQAEEEEAAAEVIAAENFQREAEAAEEEEKEADEIAEEIAKNIRSEQISPELVSKYLSLKNSNLFNDHQKMAKRTAKRASGLYSANEVLSRDDIQSLVGDLDFENLDKSLIQAFVLKILSLQGEIDTLKFKNSLEDLENDELTDALNEATMGQREGSVSNQEWGSLQHAIEIEQALQDLKRKDTGQDLVTAIKEEVEDGIDDDDDEEYKRKRGEPWKRSRDNGDDYVYSGAIASRSPVQNLEDESNADIERLLKSSYLMKADDTEDEEDDARESDLVGGDEDEPIASLFLSNADRCPAIRMYSNNCELADLYNLPVDFEARALCNLHEMCYACGHSLSVTQAQCDLVYRAAVSSLCHQKEVCIAESEIFLRTMKLKTRFIPYVQPSCRSRCTAQFMGMF